ncbi:glycosyltransferase family 2 protein [Scytonema hofmannii FACHB-248]|uniref:Glycosyltransferase family 2 protein n=1 Tax=Scytonema hofmannii FACHB-248 TaxID=1842502 RepID=A0ABR8GTV2_9CYAN|nr:MULTISPECIES: glycosyltransferase family 2 protein [Nostocales]MBD2606885.1 glycosyltransferase family 2 protein [Scytonema hofmannii FACHB-248]
MSAFSIFKSAINQWILEKLRLIYYKLIQIHIYIQEYYIRPIILQNSIKHIYGLKKINYEKNELIVLCVVSNGELYIKSFIEHYFQLGVKHIVFLFNDSTDNSINIASQYENITIIKTQCPYKKYETVMKRYLVYRFSKNKWNLFSDIDELFDYPFSDLINLSDLLNYLNKNKYTAVVLQMLDLFSDISLASLTSKINDSLKERYIYYDIYNIEKETYPFGELLNKNINLHWGGIRKTLFDTNNGLTKAALVFVDSKIRTFVYCHHVKNARIADFTGVLLHYPFTSIFYQKVKEAVETKRYLQSANHEYKMYLEKLQHDPDINIKQGTACLFKNVNYLLENNFIVVSDDYIQWVKNHTNSNSSEKKIKDI